MMTSIRALIIEDTPDDAELLLLNLKESGYQVESVIVNTLDDLSHELQNGTWSVILADFNLPGFTALDALDRVKASGGDIPFIIITGSVGEESAARAMKAGAHDFFLKDRVARLGGAIEREIREAQVRADRRQALKQLEENEKQLIAAIQARDEFLAIASHELKTPLTPLELQLDIARRMIRVSRESNQAVSIEKLEPKLEKAAQALERVTVLVNNLLEVTKVTSGHLTIARTKLDLREAVQGAVSRQREALRASGSNLVCNADQPVVGYWDPTSIETVVCNLLSNAIKYGCSKPIQIDVMGDGETARLVVADHGIGIATEEQQRIFERFERAVPVKHYGGFGVGLWLARQLIVAHDGDIRVLSNKGNGATFTVDLPLAKMSAGASAAL